MVSAEAVVSLVQGVWPLYAAGDTVVIEVLEREPEHPPVLASVGWTGAAWRVLVDTEVSKQPVELLRVLAHELGHIVSGDVERCGGPALAEQHKRAFCGLEGVCTGFINSTRAERRVDPEHEAHERKVDQWAARFVDTWLPVFEQVELLALRAVRQFREG